MIYTQEEYDLQVQRAEAFKSQYARLCLELNCAKADLRRLTESYHALENQARVYELELQLARPSQVKAQVLDEMCAWIRERAEEWQERLRAEANAGR